MTVFKKLRPIDWIAGGLFAASYLSLVSVILFPLFAIGTLAGFSGFGRFETSEVSATPVRIGGTDYRIPVNYFDIRPSRKPEHQVMSLEALWPGFEGVTKDNRPDNRVRDHGRRIRIFLRTARSGIPATRGVEIALNVRMKNSGPLEYRGRTDGFDHFVYSGYRRPFSDEFFVEKNDDMLQSFISCRIDHSVPAPSCQHWFPVNDLIWVTVTYGKRLFPEWRQIQTSVLALMKRFEVPAPE